jgi:hypothetical protein
MARRFAVQQLVLQCMSLSGLDALAYPTSNLPPPKLGAPGEPAVNGRGNSWSMLGREGFPVMTVPAGFTTVVYDRVRDPGAPVRADGGPGGGGDDVTAEGTHVVGPTPAESPVGIDFVARRSASRRCCVSHPHSKARPSTAAHRATRAAAREP